MKGKHTLQFGGNYRLVFNNRSSNATLYNHAGVTYELLGYGAIAGTASALLGTMQMLTGSVVMTVVGAFTNGKPLPMVAGMAAESTRPRSPG